MSRTVQVIAATKTYGDKLPTTALKRVGAYCRVSTDSEQQAGSFENQVEEWTKRILDNPTYQLVKVYNDDGISGTSDRGRDGFKEMIRDAKNGKLDLILVKSISRFARNTVLTLQTIKELKEVGVEVYFDTENISTFDPKNELLFTIMSSIAQEESRHISENVKWTITKMMKEGRVFLTTSKFLGYDMDPETKNLVINEDEAKIVRLIYNMYDAGTGPAEIRRELQRRGYKTLYGCDSWNSSTLTSILRNEKYKGDLLLQKTYTVDYLTHKRADNTGQEQQYYVENNHEAIIPKDQWKRVQKRLDIQARRLVGANRDLNKYNTIYPLSGMMVCYNCGRTYKRRTWYKGYPEGQPRYVFQCIGYLEADADGNKCHTQPVDEQMVLEACTQVINEVYLNNSSVFQKLYKVIEKNLESKDLDELIEKKIAYKDEIDKNIDFLLNERMSAGSFEIKMKLDEKYATLVEEFKSISREVDMLREKQAENLNSSERLKVIKEMLGSKTITRDMITKEMMDVFLYRIIVMNKREIIITINTTNTITLEEFRQKRQEIAAKTPIIDKTFTIKPRKKRMTLRYKVVLV